MSYHDKKLTPLEILFSFEGRIARLDYWLYSLIPFGIMTLGILIPIPQMIKKTRRVRMEGL